MGWLKAPGLKEPRSVQAGCACSVFACVAGGITNGAFLRNCAETAVVKAWAEDEGESERLWRLSEEIAGETRY